MAGESSGDVDAESGEGKVPAPAPGGADFRGVELR
jgi:hypothetical protein